MRQFLAANDIPQSQWQVAVHTLTDLLALQMRKPDAISIEALPSHLRRAAYEREQQGDYGAARLLQRWAHLVTQPVENEN